MTIVKVLDKYDAHATWSMFTIILLLLMAYLIPTPLAQLPWYVRLLVMGLVFFVALRALYLRRQALAACHRVQNDLITHVRQLAESERS